MASIIEIRMSDADRKRYGGPEWLTLDADRIVDTPASILERWEDEIGSPVELILAQAGLSYPPARAVRAAVWLARKQMGDLGGGVDDSGRPERFSALADLRTIKVQTRDAAPAVEPEDDDADPPAGAGTPAPTSPGD